MLQLLHMNETHAGWNAGEEILLSYGLPAFRYCKCNVCYSAVDDGDDDSSTGTEPERNRRMAE